MKAYLPFLFLPLLLVSCMTSEQGDDAMHSGNLFEGSLTSADFKWSASSDWSFNIDYTALGTETVGKKVSFIDPEGNELFQQRIQSLKEVYSFKTSSDINQITLFIPGKGVSSTIDLTESSVTLERPANAGSRIAVQSISCNCPESAPTSGTITVNNGDDICITEGFSGSIFFSGSGTVNICSDATLQNIYGNNAGIINISADALVNIGNWNNNYELDAINNYGQAVFSGSANLNRGTINNYGSLEIKGSFSQNSGTYQNVGTTLIQGSVSLNNQNNTSEGSLTINGSFNINNSGQLTSDCQLFANAGLNLNGKLFVSESSLTDIKANFTINSSGELTFSGANAHLKSERLTLNGNIVNEDANNLMSVSGQFTDNSSGSVDSKSQFLGLCAPNYGFDNKKLEVEAGCEYNIPVSSCNPFGLNTTQDSDNDGCPDDEDEFPTDPTKCYSISEPAAGYKIVAFEDLWPYKGDYDFNDLVLKCKTVYTKNAANQYVTATHTFIIQSIGASKSNGFGIHYLSKSGETYVEFQSEIVKSAEEQRSGILTAGGNAVTVSEDVFASVSSYYMNNGVGPAKAPDTLRVSTVFNDVQTSNLIADIYLFRSDDHGLEIHLPDMLPTETVKKSYFNTGHDNSNQSNSWYRTEENLPWALEIYLGEGEEYFAPLESIIITDAYPEFAAWAMSNGEHNRSWNLNYQSDKVFK